MRILVVGCGSIGNRHITNLRTVSAGDILACDKDYERLKFVKQKQKTKN